MRKQISALFAGVVMSIVATSASADGWPNPWRTETKDVYNNTPGCVRIYVPGQWIDVHSYSHRTVKFQPFETTGYFVSQFRTDFCGGPSNNTWRNLWDAWTFSPPRPFAGSPF